MDILISGAGIAGLTSAYWLRRYGFSPTIVERAPSLVIGGYKIDVRGTALEVLRKMDALDAVDAASTRMQGAKLVDRDGNVIGELSGDQFGHRVVTGDFDQDGRIDLAASAPTEDIDGKQDVGFINVIFQQAGAGLGAARNQGISE